MSTTTAIIIDGVTLTAAAEECRQEVPCSVADDVADLRAGAFTRDELLAMCLDGADEDRVQGWHDYVDAICAAAAEDDA